MVSIRQHGDFLKVTKYLVKVKGKATVADLDRFGKEGVAALASATPVDTGNTANSWYYEVEVKDKRAVISFCNSNVQDGVPIAIVLQYGHATKNGGWVEGRDYINPAIQPVFDSLANRAWREVTKP